MSNKITNCAVRMYTMGTGDCFVLSFRNEAENTKFKLMIDCGVYSISGDDMIPYAEDIIKHVDGEVDALLITHEHQDHVLGFQRAEKLFRKELKVKELWLPWTEREEDPLVADLKKEYGKKKKSLAIASNMLKESGKKPLFRKIYLDGENGKATLEVRKNISTALEELSDLNTKPLGAGPYVGGLKGMEVVKSMVKGTPRYLETGSVVENIEGLDNIKIYILGPPSMWTDVKKEHGKEGETYKHNKELELVRGFSSLPFESTDNDNCPFATNNIMDDVCLIDDKNCEKIKEIYEEDPYRRIDYDWLMSAANLSLRLTRGINNLSSVLAIEFIDSGKVMLFPGDAEYGSWKSWHEINWNEQGHDCSKHLTTDLLNRTVFYKVAHHLSHNGTAKEKGIDLMTNKNLTAMATLDYKKISKTWKNTMPNRGLIRDLLQKTKGRLIVANTEDLFFDKAKTVPLESEINERLDKMSIEKREEFNSKLNRKERFVEFVVDGQ